MCVCVCGCLFVCLSVYELLFIECVCVRLCFCGLSSVCVCINLLVYERVYLVCVMCLSVRLSVSFLWSIWCVPVRL